MNRSFAISGSAQGASATSHLITFIARLDARVRNRPEFGCSNGLGDWLLRRDIEVNQS